MKRQHVTFSIGETNDLTLPLQRHQRKVLFEIDGHRTFNLNRSIVRVTNSGNVPITNFAFEIEIPRKHVFHLAEGYAADQKLMLAMVVKWDDPSRAVNPVVYVSVPFFNPRETMEIVLFFDKVADERSVRCRMEGLRYRIVREPTIDEFTVALLQKHRAIRKSLQRRM